MWGRTEGPRAGRENGGGGGRGSSQSSPPSSGRGSPRPPQLLAFALGTLLTAGVGRSSDSHSLRLRLCQDHTLGLPVTPVGKACRPHASRHLRTGPALPGAFTGALRRADPRWPRNTLLESLLAQAGAWCGGVRAQTGQGAGEQPGHWGSWWTEGDQPRQPGLAPGAGTRAMTGRR